MNFPKLHDWDLTSQAAVALQTQLRQKLILQGSPQNARWIAGADASLKDDRIFGIVIVWDAQTQQVVESQWVSEPLVFPYVPGLLSFREAPAILSAFRKLKTVPDLVLVDGQGIAHPRRMGIAAHLGLWLDLPTIGVGKSRLCGQYGELAAPKGSSTLLKHHGEVIGLVYRSRERCNPLILSPGHRVVLDATLPLIQPFFHGYRLPEPTRLADKLSKQVRNEPQSQAACSNESQSLT